MSNALQLRFGKPECAHSGEAALAMAAQRTYDLIFMDVRMPGIDGFMTCSIIRKTLANRSTPVVLVTGLSSDLNEMVSVDAATIRPVPSAGSMPAPASRTRAPI